MSRCNHTPSPVPDLLHCGALSRASCAGAKTAPAASESPAPGRQFYADETPMLGNRRRSGELASGSLPFTFAGDRSSPPRQKRASGPARAAHAPERAADGPVWGSAPKPRQRPSTASGRYGRTSIRAPSARACEPGVTAGLRSRHAEMPHHPLHDVEVSKDAAKSIGGEFLRRIFEFFDPSTRPPALWLPDRPDPGRCLGVESDSTGFSESLEGILGRRVVRLANSRNLRWGRRFPAK
jgi:hypothetical protein